jgi:hypothetical protein
VDNLWSAVQLIEGELLQLGNDRYSFSVGLSERQAAGSTSHGCSVAEHRYVDERKAVGRDRADGFVVRTSKAAERHLVLPITGDREGSAYDCFAGSLTSPEASARRQSRRGLSLQSPLGGSAVFELPNHFLPKARIEWNFR